MNFDEMLKYNLLAWKWLSGHNNNMMDYDWTNDEYAWDMMDCVKMKNRRTLKENKQTLTNDDLC